MKYKNRYTSGQGVVMIGGEAKGHFAEHVGATEAVIMSSAIESDEELLKRDSLIVNTQDFCELPVDAKAGNKSFRIWLYF